MSRKIIGILGRKNAGKNTLADFIQNYEPFTQVAFAGPLWDILLVTDPYIPDVTEDSSRPRFKRLSTLAALYGYEHCKELFPEVRRLMQKLGSEGVRDQIGQDTWLNLVEDKLVNNPHDNFVITDLRFDNEAALIQRFGGIVVRLERNVPGETDTHTSENIDKIFSDIVYNNNYGLDALQAFAERTLELLGNGDK